MAQALVKGMIQGFVTPAQNICAHDVVKAARDIMADIGVKVQENCNDVVSNADVIVLAVKPNDIHDVLKDIKSGLGTKKLLVSIAAGVKIATIEKQLHSHARVIRVMPNTPALVREGASAIAAGSDATKDDIETVLEMMNAVGTCVSVKESQMDAVTGLSGSGPAYGFLMIEAMADGGVLAGLPRKTAQTLAAQTLLGAAKMVLETGLQPGELKDQVTSPAGTTIAGVHALETSAFRGTVMAAVKAAADRAHELGKDSH
eukprot:TRINITY_DN27393_c0_g1_i1.p1 TRINITY_DN27393_c0_g1~~TRINITY_DN27393_c0_g1_i1.p1  ORF type:complete len:277 (+),score=79.86 TRINITY_DN27393_c0_g1_i1:55-831(+)